MKSEKDCFSITAPPGIGREGERPEINLQGTETGGKPDSQLINCGYVPVVLSKLFGPLIFADIRIRAESETCEWIIERQSIKNEEWIEVARIPGQTDGEFDEEQR